MTFNDACNENSLKRDLKVLHDSNLTHLFNKLLTIMQEVTMRIKGRKHAVEGDGGPTLLEQGGDSIMGSPSGGHVR